MMVVSEMMGDVHLYKYLSECSVSKVLVPNTIQKDNTRTDIVFILPKLSEHIPIMSSKKYKEAIIVLSESLLLLESSKMQDLIAERNLRMAIYLMLVAIDRFQLKNLQNL
jgi:hypothetical protein